MYMCGAFEFLLFSLFFKISIGGGFFKLFLFFVIAYLVVLLIEKNEMVLMNEEVTMIWEKLGEKKPCETLFLIKKQLLLM